MPIDVVCPACGKRYAVAEKFAGKKARCKACGAAMVIPQLAAPMAVASAPAAFAADPDFEALAAMESSAGIDNDFAAPLSLSPAPVPAMPAAVSSAPRPGTSFAPP